MFPAFRRGVVIATGINNSVAAPKSGRLLAEAVSQTNDSPRQIELDRIAAWNRAFSTLGMNPDKFTPSIRFLIEQVRRGKPPRSINPLVDLFNRTSLHFTIPCGGDDLGALNGGDLCLGFSRGGESFVPLFKPGSVEHLPAGELTYFCPQTREALCRRWVWRNSHTTRITPETVNVAVNLDCLPPTGESDLRVAIGQLAALTQEFCGGRVRTYVFSAANPSVQIEL